MKLALFVLVPVLDRHRAVVARQAAVAVAIGLWGMLQEAGAGIDCVAAMVEGIHRAAVQAGLLDTGQAG